MTKATSNQTGADECASWASLSSSTTHQHLSHINHTADVGPDGWAAAFDPGCERGCGGRVWGPGPVNQWHTFSSELERRLAVEPGTVTSASIDTRTNRVKFSRRCALPVLLMGPFGVSFKRHFYQQQEW